MTVDPAVEGYQYLILFAVTFGNVAVRAFQQINVTHNYRNRIVPTTMVFAFFDMMTMGYTASIFISGGSLLLMWVALASAGAFGCMLSMSFNDYLNGRKNEKAKAGGNT